MSMRPEISGFRLETMLGHLGSGSATTVRRIAAESRKAFAADAGGQARIMAVVERAVGQGYPFEGLEEEDETHVCAAHLLARHGQGKDWFPQQRSSLWKYLPWELKDDGLKLPKASMRLIEAFYGRPLFGLMIAAEAVSYSWLSAEEVVALAEAIEPKLAAIDDEDAARFAGEFHGWLAAIAGRGLDLWYLAR